MVASTTSANTDQKNQAPASRASDSTGAGPTTLSGVDAIVHLLMVRQRLDLHEGLNTAAMVSGYPGSPLGGLDLTLDADPARLAAHQIRHQPGLNEELALAAVWGSQMGELVPYQEVDGVVGAWYGKTPGLDRSGDSLRHANALGSGPAGGVVLFCGDDPIAKSSTFAYDSQYTFSDACVPVLYPADPQEVFDLGLHAYRMSRFAGPLVGMKIVTAVADGLGTVDYSSEHIAPSMLPDVVIDGASWRHVPMSSIGPHRVPNQEQLVVHNRLQAAKAYVRANHLDRFEGAPAQARLGLICAGKTYTDVIQALTDLGHGHHQLARLGIRILKLAMTYPLVEDTLLDFATSVDEILVIEEKRPFVEAQARAILHEAGQLVRVLGKRDRTSLPLVPIVGELGSDVIAEILTRVMPELAPKSVGVNAKIIPLVAAVPTPSRAPAYCSGCPHNRSTVVPDGALAGGGIGCHGITYFEARQREVLLLPPPPMGAEGVSWIGLAPFVKEPHLIQNLGDGTYCHSGSLAIRACVAAGTNITFKILYNAAVAMTGGQPVAGLRSVPELTRVLQAEGVAKVVVCASEPHAYGRQAHWAPGVDIRSRDDLQQVQDELRKVAGVSVLIYDQRCATEARRLRKRGRLPTPPERVVINTAVCEGCGDCVVKSNCTSVQPVATEFGEKKRIDDLSCNRDYTCLEGECPSFVTLTPVQHSSGRPEKTSQPQRPQLPAGELPRPKTALLQQQFGIYFTSIGGTGVVTANRLLAWAAEASGLVTTGMNQTGLAQKGGAVVSHLRLAKSRSALGAATIGTRGADLYLSSDMFQAAAANHLERLKPGCSFAVIESSLTPTADMVQAGNLAANGPQLQQAVADRVAADRLVFIEAKRIAEVVFADPVMANVVLLGAAFQLGALPFDLPAMEIALARQPRNADNNRAAFEWGRWAAHDSKRVTSLLAAATRRDLPAVANPFEPTPAAQATAARLLMHYSLPGALTELIARRTAQIVDYHNAALARRFLDLVAPAAEHDHAAKDWQLTRAVVSGWFKLLTPKDEYEVGRLHCAFDYQAMAREMGIEGDYTLRYHLGFLSRLGRRRKMALGRPFAIAFQLLRRLKFLRGTALDVFGWSADRKRERSVSREYEQLLQGAFGQLDYAGIVAVAASAQQIKGYGSVKARNIAAWRTWVSQRETSQGS